ncbi:MAG: LD-carboxypeptidase [Bacteroidota bacterium]
MIESIIPPRLRTGDLIGLVSPASPPRDEALIMRGVSALLAEGFYTRIGWSVGASDGYFAGSDQVRADDIMEMFEDDRVRAIFCTRGGYGSARLLDHLDYSFIREHPKILVGFSDITALSLAMYAKAGLITFAGPMVAAEFASGIRPMAANALWEMLRRRRTTRVLPECEGTEVLQGGAAEGTLLGGNLAVLCSLVGTPWIPDFDGAVLFLEDVGESVYRIDRMLLQLKQAGVLSSLSAVLLGSFTSIPIDTPNRELVDVMKEYFLPLGVPVLSGIPFGHIPDKITLPIGSRVLVDAERHKISVIQPVID